MQRIADWVHRRIGLSPYQQSAVLHVAAISLVAVAAMARLRAGTLPVPGAEFFWDWSAILTAGTASVLFAREGTRLVSDVSRLAFAALLGITCALFTACGMAYWGFENLVGRAMEIPTEALIAFAAAQAVLAKHALSRHAKAASDFRNNRLPAPTMADGPPVLSLAAVAAGACVCALRHPALASSVTMGAWLAHALALWAGRCRPRPPSARRRRRAGAPAGATQGT